MPKGYEDMKKRFKREGLSDKAAKTKAARIWNATHKSNPVTRHEKYWMIPPEWMNKHLPSVINSPAYQIVLNPDLSRKEKIAQLLALHEHQKATAEPMSQEGDLTGVIRRIRWSSDFNQTANELSRLFRENSVDSTSSIQQPVPYENPEISIAGKILRSAGGAYIKGTRKLMGPLGPYMGPFIAGVETVHQLKKRNKELDMQRSKTNYSILGAADALYTGAKKVAGVKTSLGTVAGVGILHHQWKKHREQQAQANYDAGVEDFFKNHINAEGEAAWEKLGFRALPKTKIQAFKAAARRVGTRMKGPGKNIGKLAIATTLGALAADLAERLSKKVPYAPNVRKDVEFSPGYNLRTMSGKRLSYALQQDPLDVIQTYTYHTIAYGLPADLTVLRGKLAAVATGAYKGAAKSTLAFLLGMVTQEMLGRGFARGTTINNTETTKIIPADQKYGLANLISHTKIGAGLDIGGGLLQIKAQKVLDQRKKLAQGSGDPLARDTAQPYNILGVGRIAGEVAEGTGKVAKLLHLDKPWARKTANIATKVGMGLNVATIPMSVGIIHAGAKDALRPKSADQQYGLFASAGRFLARPGVRKVGRRLDTAASALNIASIPASVAIVAAGAKPKANRSPIGTQPEMPHPIGEEYAALIPHIRTGAIGNFIEHSIPRLQAVKILKEKGGAKAALKRLHKPANVMPYRPIKGKGRFLKQHDLSVDHLADVEKIDVLEEELAKKAVASEGDSWKHWQTPYRGTDKGTGAIPPIIRRGVDKRLVAGSIAAAGVAGIEAGRLQHRHEVKKKLGYGMPLRVLAAGWKLGKQRGQLEASNQVGSPSAIGMWWNNFLYSPSWALGRQHILARKGLHGGSEGITIDDKILAMAKKKLISMGAEPTSLNNIADEIKAGA